MLQSTANQNPPQSLLGQFSANRNYKSKPKLESYNPIAHYKEKFDVDHVGNVQKQSKSDFGNFSTLDLGGGSKIINQTIEDPNKFQFPRYTRQNKPQIFKNPITGESLDFKQVKQSSRSTRASPRQSVNFGSNNQLSQSNQRSIFKDSALQQLSPSNALNFNFMLAQQNFKRNMRRDVFKDPILGREIKYDIPKQIIGSLDGTNLRAYIEPAEIQPQISPLAQGAIQKDQKIMQGNAKKQIFTGYISPLALSTSKIKISEQNSLLQQDMATQNQGLNYALSQQGSPKANQERQTFQVKEEQQPKVEVEAQEQNYFPEKKQNSSLQQKRSSNQDDFVYLYGAKKVVPKLAQMHPTGTKITGVPGKTFYQENAFIKRKKKDLEIKIK